MIRRSIVLFLTLLVSGCTVGPDYKRPIVPVPKQWSEAPKGNHKLRPKRIAPTGATGSMVENLQ